jgi:hypothetical protein
MTRHLLILCALALAGCAMSPPLATPSAPAHDGDHRHVAGTPRARCDRIRVVCIDAAAPGLMPRLLFPTVTLPAIPNLPTLPR